MLSVGFPRRLWGAPQGPGGVPKPAGRSLTRSISGCRRFGCSHVGSPGEFLALQAIVFIFREKFYLRSELRGFCSVLRGAKGERASGGQWKESDGDSFLPTQ